MGWRIQDAQGGAGRARPHDNDLSQGTYVEPSKQTLGDYLEEWLEAIEGTLRPSTFDSYRMTVRTRIVPRLGAIPLARLAPAHFNPFYRDLLTSGRRGGDGGLSPRTVRYCHMILRKALMDAVRWGRLVRNPADNATPPKPKGVEMHTWSRAQIRAFLDPRRRRPPTRCTCSRRRPGCAVRSSGSDGSTSISMRRV